MPQFDYDHGDIVSRYDRARELSDTIFNVWEASISRYVPVPVVKRILDLGCGTGRFAGWLQGKYAGQVVGVDPSANMLAQARAKPIHSVYFVRGSAERIPLRSGWAQMVFVSMVWHHIADKDAARKEIERVLGSGGYLCVRTSTHESITTELYLEFFPTARRLLEIKLPSRKGLVLAIAKDGLRLLGHIAVDQLRWKTLEEYRERIAPRGLSDLASITDREFHEGMARLNAYCGPRDTSLGPSECVDLFVFQRS